MTQIRPEACTCRNQPIWCDACLQSGFARDAPDAERGPGASDMPIPTRTAAMVAKLARERELLAILAEQNLALVRENLALRALVRRFAPADPLNAVPDPLPWEDPAPDPDAPTKAGPFPGNALRHSDAGRVRLGAYAPTLPR
jgi:hypothetical protein